MCQQFPAVKSLYLRHGLARKDWVPALSDIDLTLVIESRLSLTEELTFLRSFWNRYARLKKLFPMLGEVDILDEESLDAWARFTIRGYEIKDWQLIYGRETARGTYIASPVRLTFDALNYSLLCYRTFLLKRFHQQAPLSYLTVLEMQRVVTKILHYANYSDGNERCDYHVVTPPQEKAEMLRNIFSAWEESIQRWGPSIALLGTGKGTGEYPVGSEHRKLRIVKQALALKQWTPFDEAIESILEAYNTSIVILRDGLDTRQICTCLEMVRHAFAQREPAPLIVSASVFRYMLRFCAPFLYTHLSTCGEIVYGNDVLSDLEPPQVSFFVHSILEQTATILAFPRSRKVIEPPNSAWFSEREVVSLVERGLFVKLYLETGRIKLQYHEFLAESRRRYTHYYGAMQTLQERIGALEEEAVCSELFRLLRDLANDIHQQMNNSAARTNLFSHEGTGVSL
jgi:predicted nucleotidyltransferase